MCGRITTVEWDELLAALACIETDTPFNAFPDWPASRTGYVDAFPRREVPLICSSPGTEPCMDRKIWGYEPYKDADMVFNTRIENASTLDLWKSSFDSRHCVIPVHAFYEPHGKEKGINSRGKEVKQLYRFTEDDVRIMLLGGIWEESCFSILTMPANAFMRPIHHRMPVLLSLEDARDWLGFKGLRPQDDPRLEAKPVYDNPSFEQERLF